MGLHKSLNDDDKMKKKKKKKVKYPFNILLQWVPFQCQKSISGKIIF